MIQRFQCDCGHRWDVSLADDGETLDARPFCPKCGRAGRPLQVGHSDHPETIPADPNSASTPALRNVHVPGHDIQRELGRGGMGVVYLARQRQLGRLVALKMVLGGGHASKQDCDRFLAEASAVAKLRHENIVQIFEIGEVEGRPYFALEYMEGGSLADQLDGTPLPTRQAAQIIVPLARAMQTAHDAGIVHRDLKPANILSAERGAWNGELKSGSTSAHSARRIPLLKITDFGLAKNLESADGPTQTGAVMGTPSYMAPEQASGHGRSVGPAADVYALGAILYELITGRPPFRGETPIDTLMQAMHEEPVRPTQLQPKCPRDLETICLKCLHKEPGKRYASAAALSDDLQRFLDGLPIHARPIGPIGRASRWARRNPAIASLTTILFAVLLTGFVLMFGLWRKAEREKQRTVTQEGRAKANMLKAIAAVDNMLTLVVDERLAYVPQFEDERRKILENAVRFYDEFLQQEGDDPELRREMGRAYFQLGKVFMGLTRFKQAFDSFSRAIELQEKLAADFPATPGYRNDLAKSLLSLSTTYRLLDNTDQAEPVSKRASDIAESLVAAHPDSLEFRETLADALAQLGFVYFQTGRFDEAASQYKRSVQEWENLVQAKPAEFRINLEHAKALGATAYFLHTARFYPLAEEMRRKQIAILEPLLEKFPDRRRDLEPVLADARLGLGAMLAETGRAPQSDDSLKQGIGVFEKLVNDYPQMPQYRLALARGHQALARKGDTPQQAEQSLKRAVTLLEDLDRKNPEAFYYGIQLRGVYQELGRTYQLRGSLDQAIKMAEQAVQHAREDAPASQKKSKVQSELTRHLNRLAELLSMAERNDEALKVQEEAIQKAGDPPLTPGASQDTAFPFITRAILWAKLGHHAKAASELERIAAQKPPSPIAQFNLACGWSQAAAAVRRDASLPTPERDQRAAAYLARATETIKRLAGTSYFKQPVRLHGLWKDPDLATLRADPSFKQWLEQNLPAPTKDK